MLTTDQREELRHLIRAELAARHPAAFRSEQITRMAARCAPFKISQVDVNSALQLLRGLVPPQATLIGDELGPSIFWCCTTAGVLAAEREGE